MPSTASFSTPESTISSKPRNYFATTHWTVVLAAGSGEMERSKVALEKLCQVYWFPLYAYVRRRGYSSHDAQDLTQGFFECLLKRQSLVHADPNRGRFRSFMLGAMNHFIADEWNKARAQKRGGKDTNISLDIEDAENRLDHNPARHDSPDVAFDKEWATALLNEVLNRLEQEYRSAGKKDLFDGLSGALAGSRNSVSYAELAKRLSLTDGNARVAVHRLRKRYRELLLTEIANTVRSPEDINDELHHLFKTMLEG
jgi:RNA polymerase sigma factor (sigma-70 family)